MPSIADGEGLGELDSPTHLRWHQCEVNENEGSKSQVKICPVLTCTRQCAVAKCDEKRK
jgi:hypothetical protein